MVFLVAPFFHELNIVYALQRDVEIRKERIGIVTDVGEDFGHSVSMEDVFPCRLSRSDGVGRLDTLQVYLDEMDLSGGSACVD